MNCDELLLRLTDYADGVLDRDACAEIELHLSACSPCGGVREDLLRLAKLCRQSEPVRLPADVRDRIRALLRGEEA